MKQVICRHALTFAFGLALVCQALLFRDLSLWISPETYLPAEGTIGLVAFAVLSTGWIFWLPIGWRWRALAALCAGSGAIALTDALYFRHFEAVLPVAALLHGGQAGQVRDSLFALLEPGDGRFALPWLLILLLRRLAPPTRSWEGRPLQLAIAPCMLLAGLTLRHLLVDFDARHPQALSAGWNPRYSVACLGLPTYHLVDAYQSLRLRWQPAPSASAIAANAAGLWPPTDQAPSPYAGWGAGRNLIVVQAEALQGFVLNLKVAGHEITPTLNRLARSSLYFPAIHAQVRAGNTSDAEFMANTGLYPAPRGAAFVQYAQHRYHALPARLKERGYASVAMHANQPGFWNRYAMYPALGFERFFSARDYEPTERLGLGLSDRAFFQQSLAHLQALPEPFYAWMVTLSSHHPYQEAASQVELPLGELEGSRLGNYLKSLHYLDRQLADFIRALEARGLWARSVFALAGDHPGVSGQERQALLRLLGRRAHDPAEWSKLQTVPFLIHLPGMSAAARLDRSAGQVDLMPTLADVMGVAPGPVFGRSLLRASPSFVALVEGGAIAGDLLVDGEGRGLQDRRASPRGLEAARRARQQLELSAQILAHDLYPALEAATPGRLCAMRSGKIRIPPPLK